MDQLGMKSNIKTKMMNFSLSQLNYKVNREIVDRFAAKLSTFSSIELPVESQVQMDFQYMIKKDLKEILVQVAVNVNEHINSSEYKKRFETSDIELGKLNIEEDILTRSLEMDGMFKFELEVEEMTAKQTKEMDFDLLVKTLNLKLNDLMVHIIIDKIKRLTSEDNSSPIQLESPTLSFSTITEKEILNPLN